jgi:hypothetical protein
MSAKIISFNQDKSVPDSIVDGVFDCIVDRFVENPFFRECKYLRVYEKINKKPIILDNCIKKHMVI